MPGPCDPSLRFEIEQDSSGLFALLFQYGVLVRCRAGITVEELLVSHFGIVHEYLEKRLSTVFLDGAPVDDIGSAAIASGMTLALSSSMPGLAGATLRRKGILASMRRSITYRSENEQGDTGQHEGYITIKLFNVLAGGLGPVLMKRGICIEASRLAEYIRLSPHKAALVSIISKDPAKDPEGFIRVLEQYGSRKVEIIIV
jgi:hypothetical protein